jgi:hypothetical protein
VRIIDKPEKNLYGGQNTIAYFAKASVTKKKPFCNNGTRSQDEPLPHEDFELVRKFLFFVVLFKLWCPDFCPMIILLEAFYYNGEYTCYICHNDNSCYQIDVLTFVEMTFVEKSFVEMAFVEMIVVEMTFAEMTFVEMTFVEMTFVQKTFAEMTFVEMAFVEMAFVEMTLVEMHLFK